MNENKSLGEYTIMPAVEQRFGSFPLVTRTSYEGELMCVAKSQNYTDIEPTFSKRHYLKVIGESLHLHLLHKYVYRHVFIVFIIKHLYLSQSMETVIFFFATLCWICLL